MWLIWTLGGHGRLAIPLSVALFITCLAVDAYRRVTAGRFGVTIADAPRVWQPPLSGLPAIVAAPVRALGALVSFAWSDLAVMLAAHAARGGSRREAMLAGRQAAAMVRGTRADAMTATTPGGEPKTRNLFRLLALLIGLGALMACLGYGSLVARAIGPSLLVPDDSPYFAGLLDSLAAWWTGLGPGGQILAIALGVALITAFGGSLALALGVTGIAAWAAGHGTGLADFVRNPEQATKKYLSTVTPGQFALDIADFALTFIPGGFLGRLGGTTARTLASQLHAAQLWKRVPAEAVTTLDGLFKQRAGLMEARDLATKNLTDMLPDGYTLADFSKGNLGRTLADLRDEGLREADILRLQDAAWSLQEARGNVGRIGATIGEFGGERLIVQDGYTIPDAFLSSKGTPGGKLLDGFAVKQEAGVSKIVVPEYKGVTASVDRTMRPTQFEGLASQGTPAYVRDRLLTDPRVADFFAENPEVWKQAKAGQVQWDIRIISTKSVENVTISEQPFTLTDEVLNALQKAIDAKMAGK